MPLIPFATNSYKSRSLPLSAQRCVNILSERQPEDTKTPISLFGVPGIQTNPFATVGNGPIRAMRVMSGVLYVLSGQDIYSISSTGVSTLIFTGAGFGIDATGPVTVMDNGAQMVFLINQKLFVLITTTSAPVQGGAGQENVLSGSTTSVRSSAIAGAVAIQVEYINTLPYWTIGDAITVILDNGTQFHTTLAGLVAGANVTIAPALTANANPFSQVIDTTAGIETETTGLMPVGSLNIGVKNADGMLVGDTITIAQVDGTTHSAIIGAITLGPYVTLAAGIPSAASAGNAIADTVTRVYYSNNLDPNFFPADRVVYFDNYFIFNRSGTNQFFLSALGDGTTYPPLSYASAQVDPDNIISVISDHETLLVFGSNTIETWYNAGTPDFPFQRYDGATVQRGTIAALSLVKEDNAVFFLGDDYVYYRLQGVQPVRVSTHAIETAWRRYSTVSDCFAFSYTIEGHKFIVLTFPTASATWVYDVATKLWHERTSVDLSGVEMTRWRINWVLPAYGKLLAGDSLSGRIGIIDWTVYTEFGNQITGQVISPPIRDDRKRIFIPRFELEMEAGVGLAGAATLPILNLNAALPSATSAPNEVRDITADPQVPYFYTSIAVNAVAGNTAITVQNADSIGSGDTIEILMDDGSVFSTTVKSIYSPTNPYIYLDYSKDGGFTYSLPQLPRSLGANGAYTTRLRWLRLGQAREWYLRLTITDPVQRVIIAAYADQYLGI